MKACVLRGAERIEIEEREIPRIKEDELLIKVLVCGICHSELPDYLAGSSKPLLMGHEPVGIVEKTGEKVSRFRVGDRVTGLFKNAFAQYSAAKESMLIKVPQSLRDEEAIVEPWSCLVSGMLRANIKPGGTVAIIGCGYMGLGDLMLARLSGAEKIIAVDIREESLALAKKFGARETWLSGEIPEEYLVEQWDEHIFEKGVDTVIEATGSEAGLELAGKMVKPHGTLSIVGYHNAETGRLIDMKLWNWKAITVVNAHERRDHLQISYGEKAMELIASGQLEAGKLMTHCYELEEINQAFQDMKQRPKNYIKGCVRIQH